LNSWFKHLFFLLVCALALPAAAASASARYNTLKEGPPFGAKIPHDLKTVDHQDQYQDFKALGFNVALITHDKPRPLGFFAGAEIIGYPLRSGAKANIIPTFGIAIPQFPKSSS